MAGATLIELDNADVLSATRKALQVLENPQLMFQDMGEYLLTSHIARFAAQVSPDGTPWAPLSPRYLKRKKKNRDKILILDGYLLNTMRYQADQFGLLFGSNRPYAALMHFGGEVKRAARASEVFFKRDKAGNVGNRFVKKAKSNFAQAVQVGEHVANYPARPWLGTSDDDNLQLLAIASKHLKNAFTP